MVSFDYNGATLKTRYIADMQDKLIENRIEFQN